ncbi:MAG: nickel pincer cofactor biosynthesis protein LarB [Oscillospiraceae bacterium]|jgi:NCAIR mutase (PurE)-related protein|nr:nickel pincer cofactor biosynthesis protein LarB [Oscillospiraceae bacterium]
MDEQSLLTLLRAVRAGGLTETEALERLRTMPFEDVGFARIDHHRALRQGFPEVIFCPGKTPGQIEEIARRLAGGGATALLASRADRDAAAAVARALPGALYHETARLVSWGGLRQERPGLAAVVSAGTADLPVAEEAALTLEAVGHKADRVYDVGVAGLHRLLAVMGRINAAGVVVVVAGMEGALASVVGGLVSAPVVAVPTSVGYGASFGGLAALLSMLNACAAGVGVVNIDNGFGAAMLAAKILSAAPPTPANA